MKSDIDQILQAIEDDGQLQDALDNAYLELHNRNTPVMRALENLENNPDLQNLLNTLAVLVNPNVQAFSDYANSGYSDLLGLGTTLRQSIEFHGELTADSILDNLVRCLLFTRRYSLDEHIENLENFELVEALAIPFDDEGLIDITASRFKLRPHGLTVDGQHLIYLHQFLRRYYSGNFVDIPRILNKAISRGRKVEVRIDPLRKTLPEHHQNILEEDYWSGPKFNDALLSSTSTKETRTVHATRHDGPAARLLWISYPVYQTDFRSSMLDDELRQIFIEEYVPIDNPYGEKAPGIGEKYHIQKFAHIVYDQNAKTFEHVDCAVRVFPLNEYIRLFNSVKAGKDPGSQIGTRYKLAKVTGGIQLDEVEELIFGFFRYNIHLVEYFGNQSEEEALQSLKG